MSGLLDGVAEFLPGYADDITLLDEGTQTIQHALDHLAIEISQYGIALHLLSVRYFFRTYGTLFLHACLEVTRLGRAII